MRKEWLWNQAPFLFILWMIFRTSLQCWEMAVEAKFLSSHKRFFSCAKSFTVNRVLRIEYFVNWEIVVLTIAIWLLVAILSETCPVDSWAILDKTSMKLDLVYAWRLAYVRGSYDNCKRKRDLLPVINCSFLCSLVWSEIFDIPCFKGSWWLPILSFNHSVRWCNIFFCCKSSIMSN